MTHWDAARLLLLLFALHALCDYPLQGDFLAKAKNFKLNPSGWKRGLLAHVLIQGGAVTFLTHSAILGLAELIVHAATDYAKCAGRISDTTDQAIHYACKVLWWALLLAFKGVIP